MGIVIAKKKRAKTTRSPDAPDSTHLLTSGASFPPRLLILWMILLELNKDSIGSKTAPLRLEDAGRMDCEARPERRRKVDESDWACQSTISVT